MDVAALPVLLQQPHPGSIAGISDTTAIVAGALLTLVVIYAIVAARLRKGDGDSPR
jgi:hypothetical protein